MELFQSTAKNIKILFNIPDEFYIFFLGSATECMDRIIQNLVFKNSFHLINGAFSQRIYNISNELHKKPLYKKVEFGKSFDFNKVTIPQQTELISIVQNETSTGVSINEKDIKKIKERYPDKLLAVDVVSSVPYVKLDYKYVDCSFFSVQKGFGLPAGLAVLIANKSCIDKSIYISKKKSGRIGSYHNFLKLYENAQKFQTTETPNTLGIFLLNKVTEQLLSYGIGKIRKETDEKAKMLYGYFDNCNFAKPLVKNPADRSKTVIVIQSDIKKKIKDILKKNGIIVSDGYEKNKSNQIRIGNFPQHSIDDIKKIIRILQTKIK
jgi:phosphoserine aminotransferase